VKKGAVKVTDEGFRYRYRAAVGESACIRSETKTFLRRVYKGAMTPVLATFLEDAELSPKEIDELQNILEKKREG
jgi:BlaI family penicillinase repressor